MLYPTQETGSRRQWRDRIRLDVQMPLSALLIGRQERIDEAKQLHNPLVLTQVFVSYMSAFSACTRQPKSRSHP